MARQRVSVTSRKGDGDGKDKEVGYSGRFHNKSSGGGTDKFVTDGILLLEISHDPLLKLYSVVTDKVHGRAVGTDLVMGFLRALVSTNGKYVKGIIMSATLDFEKMGLFIE